MTRVGMVILLAVAALAGPAHAVKIADITRISGQRTNVLTGLGLVYGLNGKGDGGDFAPAIKPLAAMLSKYADPSTVRELANAANVAVVTITATIPAEGARQGDHIDCYVTSLGKASSLRGGRLFVTPLMGPTGAPDPATRLPFALAEGRVEAEDAGNPTVGVVKKGAVMELDVAEHEIKGEFELVIDAPAASWTTANTIAKMINEAEGADVTLAQVKDSKTVVVRIPREEQAKPDAFISRIQRLPLPSQMLNPEARVQVNAGTGTIVVTGDVEISPVVISHKGLTITTINPPPVPAPGRPLTGEKNAVGLDTTGTGGPKLNDLVAVFDQLKVPVEDRITILKELHKTGKLHAKLVLE